MKQDKMLMIEDDDSALLSARQAEQLVIQMESINQALAPALKLMDTAKRRRTVRPLKDVELQLPLVLTLARKNQLSLAQYPAAEIEADLALVARLNAIRVPVLRALATIDDTILFTKGRYYLALGDLYRALSALSKHNQALLLDLEPLRQFFAKKRRNSLAGKKPASAAATVTPSALPPAPVEIDKNDRRKKPRELDEIRRTKR